VRRQRGFSLLEITVALAIFGILMLVLAGLDREFLHFDRQMRVELFLHPEPMSVLARLRRDVLDSRGYPGSFESWTQSPTQLLLYEADPETHKLLVVIYDFSEKGFARRLAYDGKEKVADWRARGVPQFTIQSYEMPRGGTAVRLKAVDEKGRLAIDQIVEPRSDS